MAQTPHGDYPIERRAGEIERLHIQGEALAPDAAMMLDEIGVREGWRCLDLGCGPGGVTDLMASKVGASGAVVGIDADAVFLEHARQRAKARGAASLQYVLGDAYRTGLPADSFDLVHSRFVASTAGEPDVLLQEAIRVSCPGGVVAFQEPDMAGLNCYPAHPAWQRLCKALAAIFPRVGGENRLAQDLFRAFRAAGLRDVRFRPFLVGYRSDHPMVDYVPATVESVRTKLLERGAITANELDAALAQCRAHLADPDTVSTYHSMLQVWGRKPA
jgi:ubiquinone/menaquinone biosynthesis C-methylase UbiE